MSRVDESLDIPRDYDRKRYRVVFHVKHVLLVEGDGSPVAK